MGRILTIIGAYISDKDVMAASKDAVYQSSNYRLVLYNYFILVYNVVAYSVHNFRYNEFPSIPLTMKYVHIRVFEEAAV